MCGIVGIIDKFGKEKRLNKEILKSMSNEIIHRGPDSDGVFISDDNTCGLSFRRLAIIDLSDSGNQPMSTKDGRFTIVFNGEIYNHQSIRQELIKAGYKYRSNTDTETILYGYQEWGPFILEKIHGMWAIAIWDNHKKEIFLARDRIGIKPLYFYRQNGMLVFGSEIKSIHKHPDISKEFNTAELPNFLSYGMSSNENSLFKNIEKLTASHYIIFNKELEVKEHKRYWSPFEYSTSEEEINSLDESAASKILIDKLRESISDRMMSDVPFGVFLSGGIDSSLNVALMDELMDRPVDTFTVGFKELEKYNELEYAKQIADKFKTNHHEILIDHNDSFDVLDNIVYHQDEPNADPVCIPLYHLSKLTRESGTTVIQVGEGSDEQFIGYKWMLRDFDFYNKYWKNYKSLPSFLKIPNYYLLKPIFHMQQQYLALEYLRTATYNQEFYKSGVPVIPSTLQKKLLYDYNLSNIPDQYANKLYEDLKKLKPDTNLTQKILFMELYQRLSELLLMRVDKMSMAHSIECRVPFLDHRLVEFSMNLPAKLKVPGTGISKSLLKKAVEGILPDNIIHRKKQGFAAPVKEWLRTIWFDYAKDKIMNSKIHEQEIFNKSELEKIIITYKSGKHNFANEIYSLLILSIWYDKHF